MTPTTMMAIGGDMQYLALFLFIVCILLWDAYSQLRRLYDAQCARYSALSRRYSAELCERYDEMEEARHG